MCFVANYMTEESINYHKHIENAIQNVLSKVKKIPTPSGENEHLNPNIGSSDTKENLTSEELDLSSDSLENKTDFKENVALWLPQILKSLKNTNSEKNNE